MRRILVDHAKAQKAQRRIPKKLQFSLDDALIPASDNSEEILAIHEALEQLARLDPQQAAIVELRFFSGLSVDETAEFLGISERTVKRNWAFARAWLAVYLGKSQKPELG